MKILSASQIKSIELATMEKQGISSLQLMEKAALALTESLLSDFPDASFQIVCGKGNNGGDGLALARLLADAGQVVELGLIYPVKELSPDAKSNYKALEIPCQQLASKDDLAAFIKPGYIIIDAIFGTGLNRALKTYEKDLVLLLNELDNFVISIDVPSGMLLEGATEKDVCLKANLCYTFHSPKRPFLFPSSMDKLKQFKVLDIGLVEEGLDEGTVTESYFTADHVNYLKQTRPKFSSKSTFGNAYLWAGSDSFPGAGILSAKAALRSGLGLLAVDYPKDFQTSLIAACPEAMLLNEHLNDGKAIATKLDSYNAIGIGPGLDVSSNESKSYLKWLLQHLELPMVVDASALYLLAQEKTWLNFLPVNTVLTPHEKEFDRLLGKNYTRREDRLKEAVNFAQKYKVCLVLKGAHSAVIRQDGFVSFNSSGNPALAKGGTGDVLCGMILSFLAQGYQPFIAACLAVYFHGKAADLYVEDAVADGMLASDLIDLLPKVMA